MPNLRARELRWNMTDGERRLWSLLRRRQHSGYCFRRQATIGPFIADFFCPKARLIIELDGYPHADEERERKDLRRTKWLEAHGCRVIRFWNRDVFERPRDVWDAIAAALEGPPSGPPRALRAIESGAAPPPGHLPPQGGKDE